VLGIAGFHPDVTMLIVAGLAVPVGFVLWLNSVKEAMIIITVFLSAVGFICPWLLPLDHLNFLARVSLGLGGVVLGIILGTLCFRVSQAVLLALIVGGILGGGLAYHDGAFPSPSGGARANRPASRPAAVASHPSPSPAVWSQKLRTEATHFYAATCAGLKHLSSQQADGVYALAVGSALVTLLLAIIFPQMASLAGGVWAGALLMLGGVLIWLEYWRPRWAGDFQTALWPQVTFLSLLVVGTAVQSRHLFKLNAARKNAKSDTGRKAKGSGEKK
jgi:hypothetical protein